MSNFVSKLRTQFQEISELNASRVDVQQVPWREIAEMRQRLVSSRFRKVDVSTDFSAVTRENAASVESHGYSIDEIEEARNKLATSRFNTNTKKKDGTTSGATTKSTGQSSKLGSALSNGTNKSPAGMKRWFGGIEPTPEEMVEIVHAYVYNTSFCDEMASSYNVSRRDDLMRDEVAARNDASQLWRSSISKPGGTLAPGSLELQLSSRLSETKYEPEPLVLQKDRAAQNALTKTQISQQWLLQLEQTDLPAQIASQQEPLESPEALKDTQSSVKQLELIQHLCEEFFPITAASVQLDLPRTDELLADLAMASASIDVADSLDCSYVEVVEQANHVVEIKHSCRDLKEQSTTGEFKKIDMLAQSVCIAPTSITAGLQKRAAKKARKAANKNAKLIKFTGTRFDEVNSTLVPFSATSSKRSRRNRAN